MNTNSPETQENEIVFVYNEPPPGFPEGYFEHRRTLEMGKVCDDWINCRHCRAYLAFAKMEN